MYFQIDSSKKANDKTCVLRILSYRPNRADVNKV